MKDMILFVYNADSGLIDGVKDYFHKIVKPGTYQCSLCALIYGNLGMNREWKEFVEDLPLPVSFLHKDEFSEEYPDEKAEFPSAYIANDPFLRPLITRSEMNNSMSLGQLIRLVKERLNR